MSVRLDPARLRRVPETFSRAVGEGLLPGYALRINQGTEVVLDTQDGLRDLERSLPVERDTVFRAFSMTKPITSVAALMLYERGDLDIRVPLATYLPEFAHTPVCRTAAGDPADVVPMTNPLSAWHLLTHTSGLGYEWSGQNGVTEAYHRHRICDPDGPEDLATSVRRLAGLPLLFQPGSAWNYSMSVDVLGRLVEVVSGRPLDEFLAAEIFGPLGMTDTGFAVRSADLGRLATFYEAVPGGGHRPMSIFGPAVDAPPNLLAGGGGLYTTIEDYQAFVLMLAAGGRVGDRWLIGPETLRFATTNHLPGGVDLAAFAHRGLEDDLSGLGFGLGFAVVTDPPARRIQTRRGVHFWNGLGGGTFFIDRESGLSATYLMSVRSATNFVWEAKLQQLVHQAIVD
ncbi:serine hydrolase [Nakamurella sp. YIM 132087]|uniref:Serine hydrolase n=1 Tax=Nakamurella alba TaxID=2665158 RepID=A0A7K1FID6_9ACTN|nr:serine hydrolase domain-containing protein [Nakamurella alba]MTD13209.1 serine hydrolase [Nakamurella alba]